MVRISEAIIHVTHADSGDGDKSDGVTPLIATDDHVTPLGTAIMTMDLIKVVADASDLSKTDQIAEHTVTR